MQSGETGGKLADMIKKAIRDCEVTSSEYDQILAIANEDGVIDSQEEAILKQLQDLISNGSVKRVAG
jgi:uncharacterized protein YutE (UPF0331/DUF86 family)